MHKSFRNLAVVAALTFVAVPAMRADRMGCNPRPQAIQTSSVTSSLGYAVLAYLGF